jgi:hypothetical protein
MIGRYPGCWHDPEMKCHRMDPQEEITPFLDPA